MIVSLGPHTLDVLTKWLEAEKDQIKLPGYSRLVGVRLRQFAEEITPQKRSEVLAALCARIREIEDKGSTANLIQASLRHLEGVKHPLVLELADFYLTSDLEGTRKSSEVLKASISDVSLPFQPQSVTLPDVTPPFIRKVPNTNAPSPRPANQPYSSTNWSIISGLVVAATILGWVMFKRRQGD